MFNDGVNVFCEFIRVGGETGLVWVYNIAVKKVCLVDSDVISSDVAMMAIKLVSSLEKAALIELAACL